MNGSKIIHIYTHTHIIGSDKLFISIQEYGGCHKNAIPGIT